MSNRSILVTGATSGIGEAIAKQATAHFSKIYITGRRADRLKNLKAELLKLNPDVLVVTLNFDVRERKACFDAIAQLKSLDVLVNNAGLALGKSHLDEGSMDHWDTMIDTNIKGLLYMTKACVELLKKSDSAHIVNICSIAGKETYPGGNVYCATKHAVDSLSKAMRLEFVDYDVKVSNVCPGAVETEFSIVRFEGDHDKAKSVYEGFDALTTEDISDSVFYCLNAPKHVNINDIVVMPTNQASSRKTVKR